MDNTKNNLQGMNNTFPSPGKLSGYYEGSHCAYYDQFKLFSAFQPVYSITHRRIVGLEGLLRGVDANNNTIPPWNLFAQTTNDDVILLDKLCQSIHIKNFLALDVDNIWLFLNVNPRSLNDVKVFVDYLETLIIEFGLPASRVVIEVLETGAGNEQSLEDAIKFYKQLGCLIAIDDFGAGHSNFERIWRIQPDIVKFDRGMVSKAGQSNYIQSIMKGVVSLLHENRCIVLAEGIENEAEAIACMEANVDLVQGFYFSRPFMLSQGLDTDKAIWPNLYDAYHHYSSEHNKNIAELINRYRKHFSDNVYKDDINKIAESMFSMDRVIRLYKIAKDGSQSIANFTSPNYSNNNINKLSPLLKAEGASWVHRPYFKDAIHNPGEIQTSEPYLSIPDGKMCITFSVMVGNDAGAYVLCCDINWDD